MHTDNPKKFAASLLLFCLLLASLGAGSAAAQIPNAVFVPLDAPCRVGDTRGTAGGPNIPGNDSVEWRAYGDDLSDQGGAGSPGCVHPKAASFEVPIAIAVNVTAVGAQAGAAGYVVAYPADAAVPASSLVNFKVGFNVANSTIVGLCRDGVCDGKFKIYAKNAVPVVADVSGYFYAKESRVATVAQSGGDYTSISAALADSASWCPAPEALDLCQVKVAPGLYFDHDIVMKDFIWIKGAGASVTSIAGVPNEAMVLIDGVESAGLEDLLIFATGNNSLTNVVGIKVDTSNGERNAVTISRVGAVATGATETTTGILLDDSGDLDTTPGYVINITRSLFFANPAPVTSVGVGVEAAATNWILTYSSATGDDAGLGSYGPATFTGDIAYNTFTGGYVDLYLTNSVATIRHSHFTNGTFELTGSTVTCLYDTGGNEMLTGACTPVTP